MGKGRGWGVTCFVGPGVVLVLPLIVRFLNQVKELRRFSYILL